ncbi:MAG: MoxR family ATPase [Anaerolineaceae bacterium]|nr:MoxR family ATPase [Anaerolineaceae bacterium]
MTEITQLREKIEKNISKVIVGKQNTTELLLVALLCDGHVLIEDVPGVGKTMLARSLAISLGGQFKRLQCTPDLLPNDITGVSIFNQAELDFEFRPGPLFVNILLVDEINRATPRTQAALLEAMQERQVTMDGVTYPLPSPFMVLATQNPVEYEGTFPLPEAQLDRFMLKIDMGYPNSEEEATILQRLSHQHPIQSLKSVATPEEVDRVKPLVWDVHVDQTILDYLIRLVDATRNHPDLLLGGSPRASLALYKAGQALAALNGRDHVLPDDIKALARPVLAHRIMLKPQAALRGITSADLVERILEETPLKLKDLEE